MSHTSSEMFTSIWPNQVLQELRKQGGDSDLNLEWGEGKNDRAYSKAGTLVLSCILRISMIVLIKNWSDLSPNFSNALICFKYNYLPNDEVPVTISPLEQKLLGFQLLF